MRLKKVLLALCAVAVLSGCTVRLTDFTVISTKNVDLSRMGEFKKGGTRVSGEDIAFIILIIPTGVANLKEAIDRAIESVPGCVALADGVLYQKSGWFIIGGFGGFVVEGTPLIDPKLASALPSNYISVAYDEASGQYVPHYLTKAEYEKIKFDLKTM